MGIDEKRLSLGVNLIDTINNELNLNVSDLSKRLVYLDNDELIVLVEDLDDNLTMPSLMEILEKINVDDKYSMCALKGQQCAFSVYIQYAYYIEEALQNRFVRINFIDDTVKLDVSDFENSKSAHPIQQTILNLNLTN